jgi:hypothetical protein
MNRSWVFIMGFAFHFCAPILSIADDINGPQPDWNEINHVKQAWINQKNSKLLPPQYKSVPTSVEKLAIPDEKLYLPFEKIPIDRATKLGIPLQNDFSKLSDLLPGIGKLKKLEITNLGDQKLFVATYEINDFRSSPVLYLQTKSKPKFILFADEGCGEIHLFRPELKLPVSVEVISSGCGSGWHESLYKLEKGGILKETVEDMGGWHANISYADLDGDGHIEILDSTDMTNEFKDLDDLLKKKIKNYVPGMAGAIICHTSILKWDGKKYSKVGEFYNFHDQ